MKKPVLIVMMRAPRMGRVKTRLAADLGVVEAWRAYRLMAGAALLRLARPGRWRLVAAITPDRPRGTRAWGRLFGRARGTACDTVGQGTGDLGRRMENAFRAVARRFGPAPMALIGTDIPTISPDMIGQCFRRLGRHRAVLGPATDGGFWLVGLRDPGAARALFRGVRWSTADALGDTRLNAERCYGGNGVGLLTRLDDVDRGTAWIRARGGAPIGSPSVRRARSTSASGSSVR